MVYVTKKGTDQVFRNQLVVSKTLTLWWDKPEALAAQQLLPIVWHHAGFNCIEVKYESFWRYESGIGAYSWDLYFQIGDGLKYRTRKDLNELMWTIEQDCVKLLGCTLNPQHNHAPKT